MRIKIAVLFGALLGLTASAQAGVIYNLKVTNVSTIVDSTLFNDTFSGYVEVPDSVAPGGSVGLGTLQSGAFDIGGYQFTLADLTTGFDGSDFDGRISSDGQSISFLSSGYTVDPSKVAACADGCFGSFDIPPQSQQSNFFVFGTDGQFGAIQFDAAFVRAAAVPEPLTLSLFGAGLAGVAAMRRQKKKAQKT